MTENLPDTVDPDAPLFTVTVAARLADMHPQTLRGYDRLGLVVPARAKGRGRRYSLRDVRRLREVQTLSNDGVNLEGISRILELQTQVEQLTEANARLVEIVRRASDLQTARTFTAASSGLVAPGRRPSNAQLRALTAGD